VEGWKGDLEDKQNTKEAQEPLKNNCLVTWHHDRLLSSKTCGICWKEQGCFSSSRFMALLTGIVSSLFRNCAGECLQH